MQLFVIRHGLAEDRGPDQDDTLRELTGPGRKKVKQVVRGLRELDIAFDRLLTSPWARARQTAELLEPLCDAPAVVTTLLCQPPRVELLAMISEAGATTAVVGHEPWLGELIAWLAFGDTRHGQAISLKKAGVAWLDGIAVPGDMTLCAVLPSGILRRLG